MGNLSKHREAARRCAGVSLLLVLLCAGILSGCGEEGGSSDFGNSGTSSVDNSAEADEAMAEAAAPEAEKPEEAEGEAGGRGAVRGGEQQHGAAVQNGGEMPISYVGDGIMIDGVPYINQYDDGYPSGCECISAVMLLNYAGVDISPGEFVDHYLSLDEAPYYDDNGYLAGGNPSKSFLGDPRTEYGWGCNSAPIAEAMEAASQLDVEQIDNVPLDTLCQEYIDLEVPVLVWATIRMQEPSISETWVATDGTEVLWVYPNHALVLVGYDEAFYYFHDPIEGAFTGYYKDETERAYTGRGMQAVVIK